MIERYIVKVDKVCDYCGFRNVIQEESSFPIEIIACGQCGKLISAPEDMTEKEVKEVDDIIKKEVKRRKEKK